MPRLPLIDIIVLLAYLGGTLGIGLWAARNNRTTDQFMAAGRKIGRPFHFWHLRQQHQFPRVAQQGIFLELECFRVQHFLAAHHLGSR